MTTLKELKSAIDVLPLDEQKELLLRLQERVWAAPSGSGLERVPGLHEGSVWMADDFNAPLPDEFWLGEDR